MSYAIERAIASSIAMRVKYEHFIFLQFVVWFLASTFMDHFSSFHLRNGEKGGFCEIQISIFLRVFTLLNKSQNFIL